MEHVVEHDPEPAMDAAVEAIEAGDMTSQTFFRFPSREAVGF